MKVPSTRPHSPASIQSVRPVSPSITCIIILIVGTLYCKDGFFTVLVIRQKDISIIFQIIITWSCHLIRISYHLLHIVFVYVTLTCRSLITVSPCQVQITFGQIRGGGNLINPSSVSLFSRQYIISSLKIRNHLTKQFFIRKLIITDLLYTIIGIRYFINPRNLTE